jgi:hypothetical protein
MREDIFDSKFEIVGVLSPTGLIKLLPLPATKTTKTP